MRFRSFAVLLFFVLLLPMVYHGQTQIQNPKLISIPQNTALDLGRFDGAAGGGVPNCYTAEAITDYSRFTYDSVNHQMLMFGGGHASTPRTDVIKFDFGTLQWTSMYPSMPESGITLANMDQTVGM